MKKIVWLDTCFPDYFNGHGGQVFSVPVDGNTTVGEVIEGIESDANNGDIQDCTWDEFDIAIKNYKEENTDTMRDRCFPDVDIWEDDYEGESVYAYFCVMEK